MVPAGLATLAALTIACGSVTTPTEAGAGSLDCAYLKSANNCWRSTATAAAGCLPPRTEQGTVSADGKTCTYASGPVVTFDNPLTAAGSSGPWSFTVTSGGRECIRYVQSASQRETLTTAAGTSSIAFLVGADARSELTCPDGKTYSGSRAALAGCMTDLPIVATGTAGSAPSSDGGISWSASFALELAVPAEILVFQCGT
jgi:hypothetical protein